MDFNTDSLAQVFDTPEPDNYTRGPEQSIIMNPEDYKLEYFIAPAKVKKKILKLFQKKGDLDYGDLIEYGFDLDVIVQVCWELQLERKIKEINN